MLHCQGGGGGGESRGSGWFGDECSCVTLEKQILHGIKQKTIVFTVIM